MQILTLKDPLGLAPVIFNIQVIPDDKPRDQRTVLIAAGISGKVPIMRTGSFGEMMTLINEAWRDLGKSVGPIMGTGTNSTTIATANIKPTDQKALTQPSKESILSLF